jgi:hypothetical protein
MSDRNLYHLLKFVIRRGRSQGLDQAIDSLMHDKKMSVLFYHAENKFLPQGYLGNWERHPGLYQGLKGYIFTGQSRPCFRPLSIALISYNLLHLLEKLKLVYKSVLSIDSNFL